MDVFELLKKDRFAAHIGIELKKAVNGYAEAELQITSEHLNGGNLVNGGVLFTLADYALAAAANSHGQMAVSLQANIQYLRSAELGQHLRAEAKEMQHGNKIANYSVSVYNNNEELVCIMTGIAYYVEFSK